MDADTRSRLQQEADRLNIERRALREQLSATRSESFPSRGEPSPGEDALKAHNASVRDEIDFLRQTLAHRGQSVPEVLQK